MKLRTLGLATAMLAISAPAFSATILNAKKVRITSAVSDWLQVAELQAFNPALINVALTAAATGGGGTWDATSTPDKAIDGNTNGGFYTDTIFHPGVIGGSFLDITFSSLTNLSKLTIFGRTDCCSSRDVYNYQIFDVDNIVLASGTLNATGPDHSASVTFAAVPEPSTWGMMLLGFGLVGGALRASRSRLRVSYNAA